MTHQSPSYPSTAALPANPTSASPEAHEPVIEECVDMAPRKKQGETPHPPFVPGITQEIDTPNVWDQEPLDEDFDDEDADEDADDDLVTGRQERRAKRARTTDEASVWVAEYAPASRDISEFEWDILSPAVRSGGLRLAQEEDVAPRIDLYVDALLRLLTWHHRRSGSADLFSSLTPHGIAVWFDAESKGDSSAPSYRSRIEKAGRLLNPGADWPAKCWRPPAPKSAPYTAEEVAALHRAASRQPTDFRKRTAKGLLALGLGAGLDGRWIADVLPEDVVDDEFGVRIWVPEPDRHVPVLRRHVPTVRALVKTAEAGTTLLGQPIGAQKNRAYDLAKGFQLPANEPGCPDRLNLSRLRKTWLTRQLTGVRLKELLAAAGLESGRSLEHLLDYVASHDAATAIAEIASPRARR